jgi:hypothetical protein
MRAMGEGSSTMAWRFGAWLTALALAGCASLTPYQQLAGGLGYAEQKIESNRYRVSYTASSRTPASQVDDYLLYRAAELTLQDGADHFVLTGKSYSGSPVNGSPVTIGVGGYGGSYGSGIGIGFGTGVGDGPPWQAFADIVTYRGAKPADEPRAYDARAVIDSLRDRVQRPAPKE